MSERYALLVLLFFLAASPSFSSTVGGQGNRLIASFAPRAFSSNNASMPLPAIGYSPQLGPVSGVIRVLVIAAAFSDINYTLSIDQVKSNWFGAVGAYYHEISYGKLTIEGDIYGWYRLPYPESHYGMDCKAADDADCSGSDGSWQIAQDAVHLAQGKVDFKNYNYFIFVHSGYGEESSGVKKEVWSVTYMSSGVNVQTPSRTLSLFSIVPELEVGGVPTGVYCLEFGHDLGLPDLYDTKNGQTILGPWELMDKGSWNGDPRGSSPAHMTAWDKIQLGFINGSQLATANPGVTSTFTVDPTEIASGNVHAIEIPLSSSAVPANASQYYLVEVRSLTGFDAALPAAGVLITYVDNNASVGKVRVIDGHPATPELMDAVWNLDQTFTDSKNGLSVTITAKVGIPYQITVKRGTAKVQQPPPKIQNQTEPYVDLVITSIYSEPANITSPKTMATISVEILNLGTENVTNAQVQITLDGAAYWNARVSVRAGSSTRTTFTWFSTVGSHVFQVTIDPNHLLNERNRVNSVATFKVWIHH